MKTKLFFFVFGWAFFITAGAQTIRYVVPGGAGAGNGTSWADASASISAMITASAANDEIWVAGGIYSLAATITVNKAVKIYGGFAGTETSKEQRQRGENGWFTVNESILDGHNAVNRVIDIESSNAVINGLSVTGGIQGGVEIARNNTDLYNAEVAYCRIHHNGDSSSTGGNGGGILTNRCYLANIHHNYIGYNLANEFGGGIYCNGSANSIILNGNTIVHNIANTTSGYNGGGGFYSKEIQYHNSKIINNIFAYNRSGSGAAIFTENGGGGASIKQMPFFNNTIYGNVGSGAIKSRHTVMPLMYNCIIYGNSSNGDVSLAKYCCIQGGGTSNGNINTNPMFLQPDSAHCNFRLQPGSPCIDSGYKNISIFQLGMYDAADSFRIYAATSGKLIVDRGAIEFRSDSLLAYVTPADSQYIITPDTTGNLLTVSVSNKTLTGYQWKYGTSSGMLTHDLTGQTSSSYTPVFTVTGTYYVACLASAGTQSILSNEIKIVVQNPLTASIAPTDTQIIKVNATGDTLKTSVNKPVSYQWRYGTVSGNYSTTVTGATGANWGPNFTSAGTYYVACNTTTAYENIYTNEVVIIVEPLLNVTVSPASNQQIAVNINPQGTLLTATPNLSGCTFQWMYGTSPNNYTTPLSGEVNATYLPDSADFSPLSLPDTFYVACIATRGAEKDTTAGVRIIFDIGSGSHPENAVLPAIYPVPVSGYLNISVAAPVLSATLTGMDGRTARTWNTIDKGISLNGIPAGTYILRLVTPTSVLQKKIIIQ